jgi:hypothetical protein
MFGSNMANARFVTWQMLDSYQGIASAMPQSPQKTAATSGAAEKSCSSKEHRIATAKAKPISATYGMPEGIP